MKNKFLLSLLLLSAVAAAVTPLQAASQCPDLIRSGGFPPQISRK